MNICFIEGDMSRRGGTERMTALLANALCKTDAVWIISLHLKENSVFFELHQAVQHLVLKTPRGRWGIDQHIHEIRDFVRKNKINWIVNVDVGTCIFGIPASWGTEAKVITWEHANYFNNWNSHVFPYFRRFAAKYSEAMVVLTERDRKNYLSHIRTNKPVYVISNPAERQDFKYDAESKIILSAGLLLPIKGYDKAIRAAAKVLSKYPEWKWLICGDGPERQNLEELIEKEHLENQMILLGSVSNMDEQYQHAAIYVMTSQMEGLPMVLLEAKSWGLPIVSFDIMTGPSDIIQDGVNGYLVQPNDVDMLAQKIEQLICSVELRKNFSDLSQLDMEKFDFENIVQKWIQIMEEI